MIALDTSVAIPLVVQNHRAHEAVAEWWGGRAVTLAGHALAETYSVLTRLPGELRLEPTDAARLIAARFAPALVLGKATAVALPARLAALGLAGGAVYDALVGLAAAEHGVELATRDARALATYESVGARVVVAAAA